MAYFMNQVTKKTVVTKIKPNKEGKVTDIRRDGAFEVHAGEVQGYYSMSFAATGNPNPVAEAFSFSPITP